MGYHGEDPEEERRRVESSQKMACKAGTVLSVTGLRPSATTQTTFLIPEMILFSSWLMKSHGYDMFAVCYEGKEHMDIKK